MRSSLVLSIDQGTSATKCVLVDTVGAFVSRAASPVPIAHPRPGWVEQDADGIWTSVRDAVAACVEGHDSAAIAAIGLSTQRESLVAWDRRTGRPASPVISWQDGRGASVCDRVRSNDTARLVRLRSGLPLDPMFSAAKASWLLDALDPDRVRARNGDLRLGTVDSWLLSRLGDGDDHVTEAGNASRTQLLNVHSADWDEDLLALFGIPRVCLPRVLPSTGPFPAAHSLPGIRRGTPVAAVLGDSHAALFGHGAVEAGTVKATYGTGSSVMGVVRSPDEVGDGLCLTIGWMTDRIVHAAEGNIRSSGATLGWLASVLSLELPELIRLGLEASSDGVMLVPAFGGLGAPWWDRDAVGLLANLTLGTRRDAIARAGLESIVQQVADVVDAIAPAVGGVDVLFVDGGATRIDGLMQMQSDRLGCEIARAREPELSALGVAHLAGRAIGIWSEDALRALPRPRDSFVPSAGRLDEAIQDDRSRWRLALSRAAGRAAGSEGP